MVVVVVVMVGLRGVEEFDIDIEPHRFSVKSSNKQINIIYIYSERAEEGKEFKWTLQTDAPCLVPQRLLYCTCLTFT